VMLPAGSTDRSKDNFRVSRAVGQTQRATPESSSLSCEHAVADPPVGCGLWAVGCGRRHKPRAIGRAGQADDGVPLRGRDGRVGLQGDHGTARRGHDSSVSFGRKDRRTFADRGRIYLDSFYQYVDKVFRAAGARG
jgi:hypothetical protein